MPKMATTTTPLQLGERPTDATAREAVGGDDVDNQTRDEQARLRLPREFYATLTKRSDVRAFLKRLADR